MFELGRPRVLHLPRRLSDLLIAAAAKAARRGTEGICAATLEWTIVVLRDGRRSRPWRADVAQLVAHHLAKVRVAGSNPVIRSRVQSHQPQRWSGRVVRQRPAKPCTRVRFPSPPPRFLGAISSAGERFPDTEEVTGSIPVSRTSITAGQGLFLASLRTGVEVTWKIPLGERSLCSCNACKLSGCRNRPLGRSRRLLPRRLRPISVPVPRAARRGADRHRHHR